LNTHEARDLGTHLAKLVRAGQRPQAYDSLAPVLAERTPFRLLDIIGESVGNEPIDAVDAFLERIAAGKTEGGWVVIASALRQQLKCDLEGAFSRCKTYIVSADIWYATDILGERVPGPALLNRFEPSLKLLAPWREDPNHWVRRTIGIAVHFWAKRVKGAAEHLSQAEALLTFLEPMFEDRDMDAIKGVGWGLKTLGRHYPDLLTQWLAHQVVHRQRQPHSLMLRKATKFLSEKQRARFRGDVP
jgi:3-methyladenine DNA glycosylase AlkD